MYSDCSTITFNVFTSYTTTIPRSVPTHTPPLYDCSFALCSFPNTSHDTTSSIRVTPTRRAFTGSSSTHSLHFSTRSPSVLRLPLHLRLNCLHLGSRRVRLSFPSSRRLHSFHIVQLSVITLCLFTCYGVVSPSLTLSLTSFTFPSS